MKTIKLFLAIAVMFTAVNVSNAQKKGTKTVVYNAELHCENCKAKIEKNIPYEKGVKDLKVDLAANTVTVTFQENKNTQEDIQKAIEKLQVPVKGIIENEKAPSAVKEEQKCDGTCCENKEGEKKECCEEKKKE